MFINKFHKSDISSHVKTKLKITSDISISKSL